MYYKEMANSSWTLLKEGATSMDSRAVYCMNLKDNRGENTAVPSQKKFNFCLQQHIIGVGWASCEENQETIQALIVAKKCMSTLKPGDLVWIKAPNEDLYYIAEILEGELFTSSDDKFAEHDLGYYRNCKFYKVGTKDDIPNEYVGYLKRLVTLQAIQARTSPDIVNVVNTIWQHTRNS